jgi:hypothetical protein
MPGYFGSTFALGSILLDEQLEAQFDSVVVLALDLLRPTPGLAVAWLDRVCSLVASAISAGIFRVEEKILSERPLTGQQKPLPSSENSR